MSEINKFAPPPPPPAKVQKQHPWSTHDFSNSGAELNPHNFHNYQCDMINHLINCREQGLGASMLYCFLGSGKSLSILSYLAYQRAWGRNDRLLIVAPKKVCELTFIQEGVKWAHTSNLIIKNMCGSAKHRQTTLFSSKADVLLINYESLGWLGIQLNAYFIKKGKPLPFHTICFDEISKMKRPESKRFKEFAPIAHHFSMRIGMTASPASNGIENVWGQFYCLDAGQRLGTDYNQFIQTYFHKEGGQYGKWIPYDDNATKNMIVNAVADITLNIEIDGNLDMPECTIIDREVILPPRKMKDYLELERDLFIEFEHGGSLEITNSVALSNKLIQTASGRVYEQEDPEDLSTRTTHYVHDEKYFEFDEIMRETGDEPLFLLYGFTSEKDELLARYPQARCLTGADEGYAQESVDLFNRGLLKLLIAHPASVGFGLNLQYACSTVIWFGATWNLEFYDQANGRINRQGQSKPVRIIRIIARDTIESYIFTRLVQKKMDEDSLKAMMTELKNKRGI